MIYLYTAEQATTPDDPRLTAYEAGRWYALMDRPYPAGATRDCVRGWMDASLHFDGECPAMSDNRSCDPEYVDVPRLGLCRIVAEYPAGTIDVVTLDGQYFRVTGCRGRVDPAERVTSQGEVQPCPAMSDGRRCDHRGAEGACVYCGGWPAEGGA